MKKQLYVLVAILVAASMVLGACGGGATPTAAPAAEEPAAEEPMAEEPAAEEPMAEEPAEPPYMLDYYWVGNGDSDARANVEAAINAYIEPLINANVTFHIIGWGDWAGKAVTALESGEKMDIFFTADWSYYSKEVNEGLLTPLNDDSGPNGNLLETYGQEILSSLNPAFITGSQINGVNYAVPTQKELSVPWGFVYNVAVADEIGFTEEDAAAIKTMADLEPWLAKAKEAHPDMYPYDTDGTIGFMQWQHGFTNMSDYVVNMSAIPDDSGKVDETLVIPMETPWMADYLNTMYSWMEQGYIDPNAGLTTYDPMQNLNAGNFFIGPMPLKGSNIKAVELMTASGNPNLQLKEIYGMPKVVNTSDTGGSMLAIPVTSENPVAAMKFLNLMHSDPTLVNMMLYGVPDVDWTVDPDGRVNVSEGNTWVTSIAGAWTIGDVTLQKVTNKEDPDKNQLLIDYSEDAIPMPSLGFRFDQTPVEAQVTAVQAVVDGSQRALLTGSVDPTDALPQFIADLKAAGLETIIAEVQSQYDAWKEAKGE